MNSCFCACCKRATHSRLEGRNTQSWTINQPERDDRTLGNYGNIQTHNHSTELLQQNLLPLTPPVLLLQHPPLPSRIWPNIPSIYLKEIPRG